MPRLEKVIPADEASLLVNDGSTLIVCGHTMQNEPMAMIRSLIKRKVKDLFLIGAGPSGIGLDMLIGAGCVKKLATAGVHAERLGSIGPRYRKFIEEGKLDVWETDQPILVTALRAATMGLSSLPNKSALGTSFLRVNPALKPYQDPISGEKVVAVPAIKPDIAVVLVQKSDPYGNGQQHGRVGFDRLAVRAAKQVIVVTEKVVPPEVITADPTRTTVSCENVVAVVEVPYGAHPSASHGCYPQDEDAILEYLAAARTDESFKAYLDRYVYEVADHEDYLKLIGIRRLLGLTRYKKPEDEQ